MNLENNINEEVQFLSNILIQSFRNIVLLTGLALSALILAANNNNNLAIFGEITAIVITGVTIYINHQVFSFYKNFIKKYNTHKLDKINFFRITKSMMVIIPFIIFIHILIILYAIYKLSKKLLKIF